MPNTPVDAAMAALLAAQSSLAATNSNLNTAMANTQNSIAQLAAAQSANSQAFVDVEAAIYNLNSAIQAAHD
ncbi:MAG: hypothetical protein WAN65_19200 [Candidatus Sulfotelmatobacter sp.]